MKIMGLTEKAYFSAWLFHYFIYFTFITFMDTLILTTICDNSSFFLLWLWLWLYCMTLFGLAIFMSAFFCKAKIGIIVGIGVWFVIAIMHDVCWANRDNFSSNA